MFKFIMLFTLSLSSSFLSGQTDDSIEIEAEIVDEKTDIEIQLFIKKLKLWEETLSSNTSISILDTNLMVDNFILFSEDGLIMKNFTVHTIESCKNQILMDSPEINRSDNSNPWIYITMESHINRKDLIEILKFLNEHKIDYHFGRDDTILNLFYKNENNKW